MRFSKIGKTFRIEQRIFSEQEKNGYAKGGITTIRIQKA